MFKSNTHTTYFSRFSFVLSTYIKKFEKSFERMSRGLKPHLLALGPNSEMNSFRRGYLAPIKQILRVSSINKCLILFLVKFYGIYFEIIRMVLLGFGL